MSDTISAGVRQNHMMLRIYVTLGVAIIVMTAMKVDAQALVSAFSPVSAANPKSNRSPLKRESGDSVVWNKLGSHMGDLHGKLPQLLKARMDSARVQGRTLFVEVGATWCEPCLELERNLTKPEFIDAFAHTSIVHLDANEWDWDDDLGSIGVHGNGIPIIVALDPQSPKATAQLNGVIDAASIKKFLNAHRWSSVVRKSDTSTTLAKK